MKYTLLTFISFILIINEIKAQTEWTGPAITISKANNADWNLEANQDRITNNVWLTRQNNKSLYNIAYETGQTGGVHTTLSPADTEWAFGSISDGVSTLTFDRFVGTLNNNVGENILNGPMVLHLITDDIYIDVTFTSWSSNGTGGGFSYTRSTDQSLSLNELELEKEIEIFPNPSSEFIQISKLKSKESYAIYNLLGQSVKEGTIENNQRIDISNLVNGVYLLKLKNTTKTLRFIKA